MKKTPLAKMPHDELVKMARGLEERSSRLRESLQHALSEAEWLEEACGLDGDEKAALVELHDHFMTGAELGNKELLVISLRSILGWK